jgi:hypothetical protein
LKYEYRVNAMKPRIIVCATFLLNHLIFSPAAADMENISGAYLKKICASYDDIPENPADGMCIGYVVGVMSMMDYIEVLCVPDKITHAQATLVVKQHLSDHPEKLHLNAKELVIDALEEGFPCHNLSRG